MLWVSDVVGSEQSQLDQRQTSAQDSAMCGKTKLGEDENVLRPSNGIGCATLSV